MARRRPAESESESDGGRPSSEATVSSAQSPIRLLIDEDEEGAGWKRQAAGNKGRHRVRAFDHKAAAVKPVVAQQREVFAVEEMEEQMSYTRTAVPMLAAPEEMPRPRGLFRQNSTRLSGSQGADKERPTFIATRANNRIIHKSFWSRVTYTVVLLEMVLLTPPWLKLLTIRRNERTQFVSTIFNESVGLNLSVSTFDHPDGCQRCDERHAINRATGERVAVDGGVTYGVSASIRDFRHVDHVQTASRVVLFASWDWERWYLVSSPGLFTGLHRGDQDIEICSPNPLADDDFDDAEGQDDDDAGDQNRRKKTTFTETEQATTQVTGIIQAVSAASSPAAAVDDDITNGTATALLSGTAYTERTTVWTTLAPTTELERETDAPTPRDRDYLSRCCLGTPGFVYLVACATPFEDIHLANLYTEVQPPGFQDRCVTLDGRCGTACDVDATAPVDERCDAQGRIPLEHLVDDGVLESLTKTRHRRHYDRQDRFESLRTTIYHGCFVAFVTMTTIGTWISFLPGNSVTRNPPKPSMTEVEDYMAAAGKNRKPLCLVTFSISATEPRMMILRNFCGKLMSWLNQRKFCLMQRNAADAIFGGEQNTLASTLFDDDNEETRDLHLEAKTSNQAELVDIFQDEGHRVGAYALWDAFVDIVHDTDLRFIEVMASKMSDMTADDDRLLGKARNDGSLLDDELRSFITKTHIGVAQESVDKLEVAFACFNLLNALGHHAYWRSDSNVNVVGFRELALSPKSADVLKQWAINFRKAPAGTNPFAHNITPTESDGIEPRTWNSWWELYSELGRIQWMKRFDFTKFRLARLHFYRDREENVFRDLVMCYSARANPEDLEYQLAPTVPLRGVRKGVFVHLRECNNEATKELFRGYGIKTLGRSEARRCHARVLKVCRSRRTRQSFVKVKECTPELLRVIPINWLANKGRVPEERDDDDQEEDRPHNDEYVDDDDDDDEDEEDRLGLMKLSYAGEEAVIPTDCVLPLRQSRGKSGGMNHAMEILNHYLRHHSSTFQILKEKSSGARHPSYARNSADAHLLFAIFDCRHMAVQGFWDAVIPYFYGYKHVNNPWARELAIDTSVAFVQLPQTFTSLTLDSDIFDMRNEYLFRLANNIRNGVGAITSCGTNAVWNYDIRYQDDPLEHRFNEDTMIEDTASSHDVIIEGRKGIYHFERLVLGARKGTTDYLAAVFRWSRGAHQLFWTTFWFPRYRYLWPWCVLLIHVCPIVAVTAYLQWVRLNECHQTQLTARSGLIPCHQGPVVGLALDPVFLLYVIFMTTLAFVSFNWCRVGAYLVMFENITYNFTASSAFFWLAIPLYMCISEHGRPCLQRRHFVGLSFVPRPCAFAEKLSPTPVAVPPVFDTQIISCGACYLQFLTALLLVHVKQWSPTEDGVKPTNQSLLRSQQMFFLNAPLHVLGLIAGISDGFDIIFLGKDASRWVSFHNRVAMATVKCWMIGLTLTFSIAIVFGVHNLVVHDESEAERGERVLGISLCVIFLFLLECPLRAMFFYDRVVNERSKPTRFARATKAVFGRAQVFSPDFVYGLLWLFLFVYSLQESELASSSGVFNRKSRCENDKKATGCVGEDVYKVAKHDVTLLGTSSYQQ